MNSLLLSMPVRDILFITAMKLDGDNFFIGDRNGVRTPMQWSPDRMRGSHAPIRSGCISADHGRGVRLSVTNWRLSRAIPARCSAGPSACLAVRKTSRAFGRGARGFLRPGKPQDTGVPVGIRRRHRSCAWRTCLGSAQPSNSICRRSRAGSRWKCSPHVRFGPSATAYLLTVSGYGFYWFRLATDA